MSTKRQRGNSLLFEKKGIERAGNAMAVVFNNQVYTAGPNGNVGSDTTNGSTPESTFTITGGLGNYMGTPVSSISVDGTVNAQGDTVSVMLFDASGNLLTTQSAIATQYGNANSIEFSAPAFGKDFILSNQPVRTDGTSITYAPNSEQLYTPSPVCYCTGTLIRTTRGDVAVEALAIGDLVVTASGARRPIRWIGHRSYAARFANANPDLLPICIKADAIAEGMPTRDLWVSPKHAMFLDGVLIPAASLVNEVSIVKAQRVETLTYWHVELHSHDVLIAENTPAESFIDDNGRGIFHNAHTFHALYPNAVETEAVYCAPRVEDGHAVAGARAQINARAGLTSRSAAFGELRGYLDICDSAGVTGWAQDEMYPNAPVCLDILVDGRKVAMAYADQHRFDLQQAGIGDGCHGFHVALGLDPSIAHVVEVRRSADGAGLTENGWLVPQAVADAA